jgi:hypothetical protein
MTRMTQGSRVRYDDASRGWSLILFGSSAFAFLLIPAFEERSHDPTAPGLIHVAAQGGIVLFLVSLWLLFRRRTFVIDHSAGTLTVTEQRLIGSSVRTFPLEGVKVRSEQHDLVNTLPRSPSYSLSVGSVWLELSGDRRVPFLQGIRGPYARQVATRLSHDLGRRGAG